MPHLKVGGPAIYLGTLKKSLGTYNGQRWRLATLKYSPAEVGSLSECGSLPDYIMANLTRVQLHATLTRLAETAFPGNPAMIHYWAVTLFAVPDND